jgi:hypothetical protein
VAALEDCRTRFTPYSLLRCCSARPQCSTSADDSWERDEVRIVQNLIGLHYWSAPSVLAGPGGALSQVKDGQTIGPDLPPWTYTPQNFGNTETYILRDGSMLMACEAATRLFHALRVYEAESGTLIEENLGDLPDPTDVSNNDSATGRLNGGRSYVGFDVGEGLHFTLDPALGTGAPDPSTDARSYWILLRVGNQSVNAKSARVKILQGTTTVSDQTATVPPTGHAHEYVIVTIANAVQLANNVTYHVDVTFPGGDVTLDRWELKSRGK